MIWNYLYWIGVAALGMWQMQLPTEVPQENPYTSKADLEQGKRLFAANCAVCHGPAGTGGRGANLARPKLQRASNDHELFFVIRQGVPGTEMPPAWLLLNEHELWQVTGYVRSLGRVPTDPARGDARAGSSLFHTAGCLGCHQVGLEGGHVGPSLTDIGLRRGAVYLRAKIMDPAASLPDDFLQVTVAARDGKKITGVRLNEDGYSIQVRDWSNQLFSFWKEELVSLDRQPGRTPMPSYRGRISDSEVDDVVAYLVSLRGER